MIFQNFKGEEGAKFKILNKTVSRSNWYNYFIDLARKPFKFPQTFPSLSKVNEYFFFAWRTDLNGMNFSLVFSFLSCLTVCFLSHFNISKVEIITHKSCHSDFHCFSWQYSVSQVFFFFNFWNILECVGAGTLISNFQPEKFRRHRAKIKDYSALFKLMIYSIFIT